MTSIAVIPSQTSTVFEHSNQVEIDDDNSHETPHLLDDNCSCLTPPALCEELEPMERSDDGSLIYDDEGNNHVAIVVDDSCLPSPIFSGDSSSCSISVAAAPRESLDRGPMTRPDDDPSLNKKDAEDMIDTTIDETLEDQANSMSDDDSNCNTQIIETTKENTAPALGGLTNLGNTCYIASALQMIASLDHFVENVRDCHPDYLDGEDDEEDRNISAVALRSAFLDMMRRLQTGETVHPGHFKTAIDERSPLFVGYRQQDSHEFLTTLLELLDDDYKKKRDEDLEDSGESSGDVPMDQSENVSEDAPESIGPQRVDETPAIVERRSVPKIHRFSKSSFSKLDVDDIRLLLQDTPFPADSMDHESSSPALIPLTEISTIPGSHCKLVGGRMSTSDVILTPFLGSENAESEQPFLSNSPQRNNGIAENDTASQLSQHSEEEDSSSTAMAVSPVDSYFTTEVRVRLTCNSCKYMRTHKETYRHLSLDIGSSHHDSSSILGGIRNFFAPEKRELKCEKCFCPTATQTSEITKLPRALLLHFKRFIVEVSQDYSSVSYRKDQSPVHFDSCLSLDENAGVIGEFLASDCSLPESNRSSVSTQPSYSIRSVVNHIGSSAGSGHYTADAHRRYGTDNKRQWTRFNDDFVSLVDCKEVTKDSFATAYLVMYELE